MELGESINRKNKNDLILKSIIWNNIIDIFLHEKNIDITQYLISITIKGKKILIKTNNPLINSELGLIGDIIHTTCYEKLKKIGIIIDNFEIKYI